MEAKFYIYARGRWCEVDTRSGRVEGFKERARFLFFKGGKLELARTAKALQGLRALAAGKPGSIRDGPPLPLRKRRHRRRSRRERDSRARAHHHGCCIHSRCDVNANDLRDKPVLPAPPAPPRSPPPVQTPSKRRIIYSDEQSSPKHDKSPVKEKIELEKLPKQIPDIVVIQSDESSDEEERKRLTRSSASKLRRVGKVVDSESDKQQVTSPRKRNGKQEVSFKENDEEKSKKATENKKSVSIADAERLLLDVSDSEESDNASEGSELAKELVIDEEDVIVLRRYLAKRGIGNLDRFDNDEEYKRRVFYKLNPLVTLERCKSLENLLRQKMTLKEFARNLGLRSVAEVTPEKRYRMRPSTKMARAADSETDKENCIVKPKRRKLWNNDQELFNSMTSRSSEIKPRRIPKPVLNEDSSKDTTDSDTEFKRKVREQLTRKSNERASAAGRETETATTTETTKERRTTRSSIKVPLKEQNKPSEDKDKDVATIGSLGDVRRTRSSDRGLRVPPTPLKEQNKATDSSDSAFETSKLSPKKPAENTVAKASNAEIGRNKKGRLVREGRKVDERVEKMKSVAEALVRSVTVQPVKIKASSVPLGREYTSLEDHAIVAWVSVGGRERRVNGNALWRELQAEYSRITGQDRSWHSLRNRYLRYVLPALGRLALPPAQVSRLRAAAAAGLMKARGGPPRRNSIYAAPAVRSASARPAPGPPPRPPRGAPAPQDRGTPPRPAGGSPLRARPSPTYSAVTRRFAARTRAAASLASTPSPSPLQSDTIKRRSKR